MSIDWNKVKSNAKAKDDQQYAAMKADTEKRGPYSVSTGTSQPTGFTPAQKSEMASLENQRRQAQVDMDIDTMNALDARMKAIRASAGQQTLLRTLQARFQAPSGRRPTSGGIPPCC